uniref:Uncharacterized protein n=1 Tax=Romanomermis culicivorax TaxID=13658 RepID=A0A915IJ61_ROMCU
MYRNVEILSELVLAYSIILNLQEILKTGSTFFTFLIREWKQESSYTGSNAKEFAYGWGWRKTTPYTGFYKGDGKERGALHDKLSQLLDDLTTKLTELTTTQRVVRGRFPFGGTLSPAELERLRWKKVFQMEDERLRKAKDTPAYMKSKHELRKHETFCPTCQKPRAGRCKKQTKLQSKVDADELEWCRENRRRGVLEEIKYKKEKKNVFKRLWGGVVKVARGVKVAIKRPFHSKSKEKGLVVDLSFD